MNLLPIVGSMFDDKSPPIMGFLSPNNRRAIWEFECDCGNKTEAPLWKVKTNHTKSCGCLKHQHAHNRISCGDISGTKWYHIRQSAERRNIDFDITIEEGWDLFLEQDRKCRFTGEILSFCTYKKTPYKNNGTASLDRIDSTKGYSKDNCQWIHKKLQRVKGKMQDNEFIELCHKISSYCTNQDK